MDSILEALATHPGFYAFLLLLACGLGLPPWSEELVLLASGFLVAEGHFSYFAAVAWCASGILVGDSVLFLAGRLAGERVGRWPLLRRAMRPARRRRFNTQFLKYGTRVVFLARFLPGVRMLTYLVAGNLGMPWWKFLLLDLLGMVLTVPVSIWLGWQFSSNLDQVMAWTHRLQVPLAILAVLAGFWIFRRMRRTRWARLQTLRQQRRERDRIG